MRKVLITLAIAFVVWVGGTVASHERELAGMEEKVDAIHDDVKIIKKYLLKKSIEE